MVIYWKLAGSSGVERFAHNEKAMGSNPIQLKYTFRGV